MLDGARSSPLTGDGISADAIATPLIRTSYREMLTEARAIPTPLVACACGSLSTSKMCRPERASAAETLTAVVDFPTPPFWFAMAITRPIGPPLIRWCRGSSLRVSRLAGRTDLPAERTFQRNARASRIGGWGRPRLGELHHRAAHTAWQLGVKNPQFAAPEQHAGALAGVYFPANSRSLEQHCLSADPHEGERELAQRR